MASMRLNSHFIERDQGSNRPSRLRREFCGKSKMDVRTSTGSSRSKGRLLRMNDF